MSYPNIPPILILSLISFVSSAPKSPSYIFAALIVHFSGFTAPISSSNHAILFIYLIMASTPTHPVENLCSRAELAAALGNSFGPLFECLATASTQVPVLEPASTSTQTSMIRDASFFKLDLAFNRRKVDDDRCSAAGYPPNIMPPSTVPRFIWLEPSPVPEKASRRAWYEHFQTWAFPFRTDAIRGLTWGPYPTTIPKAVKRRKGPHKLGQLKVDATASTTTLDPIRYPAYPAEHKKRLRQGIPKYMLNENFRREAPKRRRLIPILRPLKETPTSPSPEISRDSEGSKRARSDSIEGGEEQGPSLKRSRIDSVPMSSQDNKRPLSPSSSANEAKRARTKPTTDVHEPSPSVCIGPVHPFGIAVVRRPKPSVTVPGKRGPSAGLNHSVPISLSPSKAKKLATSELIRCRSKRAGI